MTDKTQFEAWFLKEFGFQPEKHENGTFVSNEIAARYWTWQAATQAQEARVRELEEGCGKQAQGAVLLVKEITRLRAKNKIMADAPYNIKEKCVSTKTRLQARDALIHADAITEENWEKLCR